MCSSATVLFYSGLKLNTGKTELFYSGLSAQHIDELEEILGFKCSYLPVKYLGVPLISSKLRAPDCSLLIKRMVSRVNNWSSKCLSFAGRLQLISSVLHSMVNYWFHHFILPKKIIKQVQQICSSFFWRGDTTRARGAKVSWDDICYPKREGGLGLKNLEKWNQVCILKNLWQVLINAGSLWVAWASQYSLKEATLWKVKARQNDSWSWQKILQLRDIARPHARWKVGDGSNISFWHDHWSDYSPLSQYCSEGADTFPALGNHAKLSTIIEGTR